MIKILIIEDEKNLLEEIGEILRFEGFAVLQAEDGPGGLELARTAKPDLILCDIMLPGIKGTEILDELIQNGGIPDTGFIFITAMGERSAIRSGMEKGADDYLVKPFTVNELLGTVRSRLQKASARQKQAEVNLRKTHGLLVRNVKQLKEEIADQNNEIDLLKLENQTRKKTAAQATFDETFRKIDSANKIHNLERLVKKELKSRTESDASEQLLVSLSNEIRKSTPLISKWAQFQTRFNEVYPDFCNVLGSLYPSLRQPDLALASAIVMNLSTMQIAAFQNITAASVRKNKYRLKKKLNLAPKVNLNGFFHQINLMNAEKKTSP
jgi:DNA-binding response OmpR family regulator